MKRTVHLCAFSLLVYEMIMEVVETPISTDLIVNSPRRLLDEVGGLLNIKEIGRQESL